jgi:hypothetical protein
VFSIKNADTSEQKSNFSKIFIFLSQNELRATSDEKRLYFRIKRAGSSNYRGSVFLLPEFTPSVCLLAFEFTLDVSSLAFLSGAGGCFFAFIKKSIANSKSERSALISLYPDNHCLLTRYPDNRYSIQSTNYFVRNYQRIMQNKPNFQKSQMNVSIFSKMAYENKWQRTLSENKPNSKPVLSAVEWANFFKGQNELRAYPKIRPHPALDIFESFLDASRPNC